MEATPAPETNEHPHRRLNVVPKRICTDCIHYKRAWDAGVYSDACKAGDVVTSPINGDKTYVTLCEDKNADGECQTYVAIDHEAIAKQKATNSLKFGLIALAALAAFFSIIAVCVIFGSPSK